MKEATDGFHTIAKGKIYKDWIYIYGKKKKRASTSSAIGYNIFVEILQSGQTY